MVMEVWGPLLSIVAERARQMDVGYWSLALLGCEVKTARARLVLQFVSSNLIWVSVLSLQFEMMTSSIIFLCRVSLLLGQFPLH